MSSREGCRIGSGASVVGGGVLGLSVGVALRLLGVRVLLVTDRRLDRVRSGEAPARWASAFPAASVLPHSCRPEEAQGALGASLQVFSALHRSLPAVVRRQRHVEVFEQPVAVPRPYLELLDEVRRFHHGPSDPFPLKRTPKLAVSGWSFPIYFVEMPLYVRFLVERFEALGGEIRTARVRGREELLALPGRTLVVCAGMGSPEILGRREEKHFELGHLLHVPIGLDELRAEPASYTYVAADDLHANAAGPMDLYAYPRTSDLVLGASRLAGVERTDGSVEIEPYRGRTVAIPGPDGLEIEIPSNILHVNRLLVRQLLGVDIDRPSLRARVGWRYRGTTPGGGTEQVHEIVGDRRILARYALGGAGVTLSWGWAAQLAAQVPEVRERYENEAVVATTLARMLGDRAASTSG